MKIGKTVYIHQRQKWRAWLKQHFQTEPEIWLLSPKKASGKPAMLYNDAVEEALCFGWIDSILKTYDQDFIAQRYSPRKPSSNWSQPNKERLSWLLDHKLVHPSLVKTYQQIINKPFIFPKDILTAIKKDPVAWTNYQNFAVPYQRIRTAYIDDARKQPEEFQKRLRNFIKKTKQGKMIVGYGGIEKYYK